MDNRQRARARDENQRRTILLEVKHKNFIAAVRKRGITSCHQGGDKKVNRNTYRISSIKRVIRKFHVVVGKINGKEMYKKACKVVFC